MTGAVTQYDNGDQWTGRLSDKTICMVGLQNYGEYKQYDVHNLFGHIQTIVSFKWVLPHVLDINIAFMYKKMRKIN